MKLIVSVLLSVILVAVCTAQPTPDTLWTRTYGRAGSDAATCVRLTTDGNFVVAGTSHFSAPDDMCLVKLNGSGDTLWTRVIDLGNLEQANSVWPTDDGGYALTGSIQYIVGGNTALLLVKTNSVGDTLWTRAYGTSGMDKGYAIQQTVDGGFVIAGGTRSDAGDEDVYLIKTNAAGDTIWTRTYAVAHDNYALSVESTSDGGYVIAGYSTLPPQVTPAFVMKTGSTGILQWRQEYGGLFNMAVLAEQTNDGGYMVAGTGATTSGTPHLAPYLMKTDSAGNPLWTQMHSVNPLDELAQAAHRTSDGGYVLAGWIGNIDSAVIGTEIIRMDSLGAVQWSRTYGAGTGATAASVIETANHSYVAAGNVQTSANGYDMYVVRSGPEGLVLVYPNEGEILALGHPLEIRWNGTVYGGSVSLQVNRSYPSAAWETVAATPNNGHYTWIVSGEESNHVRFRIQHVSIPALSDTSDTDLSFRIPRIHLLWPNGGETVLSGVRDTVRFERVLVSDFLRLQINRDYPGGTWDQVTPNISGDSTAFWTVQLPGGMHCRLRLVSMSDSTLCDTSNTDFVLRAPLMSLTAPNGGEQIQVGVPYAITWVAPEHHGNIRITLNRDYPSGSWENVAASLANGGSYSWTPSAPASEHCRVRVSTVLDAQSMVESAGDFAITAASADNHTESLPTSFALDAPYPNPFNSQTVLSFSIPARGEVTLAIHDLSGRELRVIKSGFVEQGNYRIAFDGSGLPSGTYFCSLKWGEQSQVRKMMLLK